MMSSTWTNDQCLQVLKFETKRQPQMLGGSVFGYNDAYKRLHPFLKQWRLAHAAISRNTNTQNPYSPVSQLPGSPITQTPNAMLWGQLEGDGYSLPSDAAAGQQADHGMPYIVSIDVSRAFDNIDAEKLLRVVEPLFKSQEYLIVKYAEVSLPRSEGIILLPCTCPDSISSLTGDAKKVSQDILLDT